MSYFTGTIYSHAEKAYSNLTVILPHDSQDRPDIRLRPGVKKTDRPKTVILLHGLLDNATSWLTRTSILRYAEEFNVAVLLPEVHRSWYQNMAWGQNYFDYITKELPDLAEKMFRIDRSPDSLLIGGFSMGGYGAMKCVLTCPEAYCAAGAFSGACDLKGLVSRLPDPDLAGMERDVAAMFGQGGTVPGDSDLFELAGRCKKELLPPVYLCCGTEDELIYEDSRNFDKHLTKLGISHRYEEWSGGHEFGFWDQAVERFLAQYAAVS